jgi:hypothetical protein
LRKRLSLDNDAVKTKLDMPKNRRVPLGKAASELIRHGVPFQLGTKRRNGLPVLDASEDLPVITSERVRELLEK